MDNILLLNANKKNIFEFDVEVQGVDASKSVDVRFVMHVEDIMYGFPAKKEKENSTKYVVEVPSLPHLPKSTFNFTVELITDGYLFEGAKGVVNISGDPLAHVTAPKVQIKEDPKEEKEKKAEKKKEIEKKVKESSMPTRPREKSIEQLANEVMVSSSAELAKKEIKVEPVLEEEQPAPVATTKSVEVQDDVVKNIINKLKNIPSEKLVENKPKEVEKQEPKTIPKVEKPVVEGNPTSIDIEAEKKAKQILEAALTGKKEKAHKNFVKKGNIVER